MPPLTLRKRKPKNAANIKPAASESNTVTPVKPRPKPRPKKKAPAGPSDGEAMLTAVPVAQVAPQEDENGTFKLRIAAETLASLKNTVPNPEPTDLEIDDIGIGYGELPWNSVSADDKARDSEEEEESADSEEVDELIDDLSDDGLEEHGEIIFHP
jgi:hypothetical protein